MVFVIGFAGYLLSIPRLIWAWVRWFKPEPRFAARGWRNILDFCGLILVSAIGFLSCWCSFTKPQACGIAWYNTRLSVTIVGQQQL